MDPEDVVVLPSSSSIPLWALPLTAVAIVATAAYMACWQGRRYYEQGRHEQENILKQLKSRQKETQARHSHGNKECICHGTAKAANPPSSW